MKITTRLLIIAALFALVLPLVFTGTTSAKYMDDGAVPDGLGGWKTPNDGICVVGLHADGTMDVAAGITSKRDCIYLQSGTLVGGGSFDLTGMTTSAACATAGATGNDGAKHQWATSFCTKSLNGLDRTQKMCEGIGGTWVTTGKCVAYSWLYRGQNASGTPYTLATAPGFCYARMNTDIAAASCPSTSTNSSTAFGYRVTGTLCQYDFGVNGAVSSALTKADGTTVAATTVVDLTAYTTMGTCLANGGSWSAWIPAGSTATIGTTTPITGMTFDLTRQAVNADEGCLHCHSSVDQANGPAERWKDSYLKTGHKNMLRKVSPPSPWAGPDGLVYTTDGTNSLDFSTGLANGTTPFYYVYGDWMAANPTIATATAKYGCGACHTAGFSDATNPGVQSIGTPGYIATQPADSGTDYVSAVTAGHTWDLEGIQCSRCHNATVPSVTAAQIAASSFPTTYETKGGMGNIPGGPAAMSYYSNYLCFGCHQSGVSVTQNNPVIIPTGISHGASWGRDFNGHVLGNSFLNSPHARFTGTVQKNSLGKYDLFSNTAANYSSTFQGYMCWQSASSNSPAKTKADGTEIKDKATCEGLYGAGAWRTSGQGSCTVCHDVHQSLYVDGHEALRKECVDCHENADYAAAVPGTPQYDNATMGHPQTAGTPWDATLYGADPCAVCHMATQAMRNGNQNSMPVHVWRINTDATYDTFPTAVEFAAGTKNAKTAPDGAYTNAVWVDLDLACGQCHGGSLGVGANGATLYDKNELSGAAKKMHDGGDTADNSACLTCHNVAQGVYRAVNQGVDHHNGSCAACHAGRQHKGNPLMPTTVPADTLKPAGSHNPLPYWSIDNADVRDRCLSCHATVQTRYAGGTVGAIVPSGTGDNHHGGHSSVPGTTYGGVSEANGSRGDNDPGMNCLGCHGRSFVLSGDNSTGYVVGITASGLSTTTVSTQVGVSLGGDDATSNLCLGCHGAPEIVQTGTDKNHHSGACVSCHHADGTWSGTFPAGVGSVPAGKPTLDPLSRDAVTASCQGCHATAQGSSRAIIPSGAGDNHHRGSSTSTARSVAGCLYCHGEFGGIPFGGADTEAKADSVAAGQASPCQACHGVVQSGATQDHHVGDCLTCHLDSRAPFPGDTDGQIGANALSRDAVTTYCQACHFEAQGSSRAIIPSGAGDNHHRGSSTSTARSVAGCMYCHGEAGGVPFGGTETEAKADSVAAGQSSPCQACHGVVQSGTTQDHHAGDCLTCHLDSRAPFPGDTDGAVGADSLSRDAVTAYCQACHVDAQGSSRAIVPSGTGDNHHRGSATSTANSVAGCLYCHGETGGVPFGGAETEVIQEARAANTCNGSCHASTLPSGGHHTGEGMALTNGTYCLTCHTPTTTLVANPGVGVSATLDPLSRDDVTATCQACHASAQGSFRAIVPSGTGDNHHAGSSTTTARGVAGCLYCHGEAGGAKFGHAATEVMEDQVEPNTCNGACHSSTLPSLKEHHPGTGLPLTNNTLCVTCHIPSGKVAAGVTTPAFPAPDVADCTGCHTVEFDNNKHVTGSGTPGKTPCETCHVYSGVKPTTTLCQACHTGLGVVVSDSTVNNRMVNIHSAAPTAAFSLTITGTTAKLSGMASTCPSGTCNFLWETDNGTITNPTAMGTAITGGTPGAVNVTLFISDSVSGAVASKTKVGTFVQSNRAPVAVFAAGYPSLSGWTLTVKDASTDPDGPADLSKVNVKWGDGATKMITPGATASHTYTVAGNYTVTLVANDVQGLQGKTTSVVNIGLGSVTGTVTNGGVAVSTVKVTINVAGVIKTAYTNASGVYTINNVKPGTGYVMMATKGTSISYTKTVNVNAGVNTVNFP